MSAPARKRWLPLEANPDVVTVFAASLGADTSTLRFCDVFSLDEVKSGEGAWFLGGGGASSSCVSIARIRRGTTAPPRPASPVPGPCRTQDHAVEHAQTKKKRSPIPALSVPQDMLSFVPRPVAALVLLFPITPVYEAARKEGMKREMERVGGDG